VKEAISYLKFLEMGNRECDKCQSPASRAGDNGTVSLWRWKEGYSYERLRTPKRIESMIQRLPRMQFLFSYSMTWWGQSRNQTWSDRSDTLRIPTAGCHFDKISTNNKNILQIITIRKKLHILFSCVIDNDACNIFFLASYAIISDITCACQEWR
jgi:hypothetical protein